MAHHPASAAGAPDGRAAPWPATVAVIGGGTMGLGFAELLSGAGIGVRLADASPELGRQAHERLVERAQGHVDAGLLEPDAVDAARGVEVAAGPVEAADGVDLVLEAVSERLEVKRDVLGALAGAASADAVIASNTSSFPIDELAEFVTQPARFLGMHWFNPPEWTPGVEVIPHAGTDAGVVDQVMDHLRRLGKQPVVVGSGAGFVANRIQMALLREALACVDDGLASPREVDQVVRSTFGFRLPFFGPFQIADMAGIDVMDSVFGTLARDLGESFRPPGRIRELMDQGRLGTKSGAGFFTYSDEERRELALERDRRYAALGELLGRLAPVEAGREE